MENGKPVMVNQRSMRKRPHKFNAAEYPTPGCKNLLLLEKFFGAEILTRNQRTEDVG